ncbi:hypothetical protein BAPNAU_0410 [Bacillus velezensis NAU-B3]|nr:hypothetical protein BAPNAU_0410 [Bacillus velezensis NAU-B3]
MGKCPLFTFLKERSTHPRMIGRENTLCERHRFFSRNDAVFIFGPFFGGIHIIDKTGHQCAGLLNINNLTSHNSGFMM